ncbi:MAG: DUF2079 domain-containing protein [Bacteroidia bacterium]
MIRPRYFAFSASQFWLPLLILALFGVYYGMITFVNHAQFRTFAFDLGYYNHAVYEFGHFRLGKHVLENSVYWHTWGDHFEPILILFGPLVYIFDDLTMLVVQLAAVLIGGIGILRYFQHRSDDQWLPVIAMAQFLSIWGITSALAVDFHTVVVGAMIVPWMLLYYENGKRLMFMFMVLLFVGCGEKVSAWGLFIFLGLALLHLRERRKLIWALSSMAFCLAWTIVAIKWVMPIFVRDGHEYRHFLFHIMGENNAEVIKNMVTQPGKAFRLLYESHLPEWPLIPNIKVELWKMIALSGGIALLRRPQYFIMLSIIVLAKVYNDQSVRWGINAHYSVEFAPILCIALYEWVKDIRLRPWRRTLAFFFFLVTIVSTYVSLSTRYKWDYRPENTNIFDTLHWEQPKLDVRELQHAVSLVPPDVPVTASDRLVPHIPLREKIYMFPTVLDAEYVLIQLLVDTYPLSPAKAVERKEQMVSSGEWDLVWEAPAVAVLRRHKPH